MSLNSRSLLFCSRFSSVEIPHCILPILETYRQRCIRHLEEKILRRSGRVETSVCRRLSSRKRLVMAVISFQSIFLKFLILIDRQTRRRRERRRESDREKEKEKRERERERPTELIETSSPFIALHRPSSPFIALHRKHVNNNNENDDGDENHGARSRTRSHSLPLSPACSPLSCRRPGPKHCLAR